MYSFFGTGVEGSTFRRAGGAATLFGLDISVLVFNSFFGGGTSWAMSHGTCCWIPQVMLGGMMVLPWKGSVKGC
jgi:hypothetical protein